MIARRPVPIVVLTCVLAAFGTMLLTACAGLQTRDPLQVTVAGIEPLPGEGMELRMMVKLRVQNPNDAPVDYNGVALQMEVQGRTFASGVADTTGSVPRFGESVISVPVTISAYRMVRQAVGLIRGESNKISYAMRGKLSRSAFSATRFTTKGEIELPEGVTEANSPQ